MTETSKNNPLVSVIIPLYNGEKYIREWAPPEYTDLNMKAIQVGQELIP